MSEDHKPSLPEERSRIESAGLSVDECGRVKKSERESVGVARAFGDFDYKTNKELDASLQAVTCAPEIRVHERVNDEDMYLILGKRNLMFGNGHFTLHPHLIWCASKSMISGFTLVLKSNPLPPFFRLYVYL